MLGYSMIKCTKPFREEEIFAKLQKHLRFQFVYQVAGFPSARSEFPADWVKKFCQVKRGRSRELLALIDRVDSAMRKSRGFWAIWFVPTRSSG